jgi:hypothetical protein
MDCNFGVSGTVSVHVPGTFYLSARDNFIAFSHREMYCSILQYLATASRVTVMLVTLAAQDYTRSAAKKHLC